MAKVRLVKACVADPERFRRAGRAKHKFGTRHDSQPHGRRSCRPGFGVESRVESKPEGETSGRYGKLNRLPEFASQLFRKAISPRLIDTAHLANVAAQDSIVDQACKRLFQW